MKKKSLISLLTGVGLIFYFNLNALSLKQSVVEVLNTNPIVKERLSNIREVQQDLNIAEAEY